MKNIVLFLLLFPFNNLKAKGLPANTDFKTPPKIIRTCCSFGVELKLAGVPFKKYSDISSVEKLGEHKYLGNPAENNGIIYTLKGGFIDIGHLRDQADWTAYLYSVINSNIGKTVQLELGHEGGTKILDFTVPVRFSQEDRIRMAGNIAYDLSIWHEIATFYGASTVPLIPERYSAFSMEDAYSNMLGVQLGMAALHSPEPFEKAMTDLIFDKLKELKAVKHQYETAAAMELVKEDWWTDSYKLPSRNVLIKREFAVENHLTPWLVNDFTEEIIEPEVISLDVSTENGEALDKFYRLSIKLNYKFNMNKILPKSPTRIITQKDFQHLIKQAEIINKEKGAKLVSALPKAYFKS
ncbi:MAG: DUF4056 domain-containing protein [Cytophagales bacterium]|nr:DUF4056 domain-containing protein [Cytophagales bacterium]